MLDRYGLGNFKDQEAILEGSRVHQTLGFSLCCLPTIFLLPLADFKVFHSASIVLWLNRANSCLMIVKEISKCICSVHGTAGIPLLRMANGDSSHPFWVPSLQRRKRPVSWPLHPVKRNMTLFSTFISFSDSALTTHLTSEIDISGYIVEHSLSSLL